MENIHPRVRVLIEALTDNEFGILITFDCYTSISEANQTGDIPLPRSGEMKIGSHAVNLIGYSIKDRKFIFRNSLGEGWGNKGDGTLPFEYAEEGLITGAMSVSVTSRSDRKG